LLSVLFAIAIVAVGWGAYRSWKSGPLDIPTQTRNGGAIVAAEKPELPPVRPPINTEIIISKNLFDPERGAGATREAEENSRAFQRVRNMILVGTVIIGTNRVAILQEGSPTTTVGQRPTAQAPSFMRLKVGDNIDGFRLTEIADKRVVFAKDASRVEVLLDYFRKVETPQPPAVASPQVLTPPVARPVPRVVPNLPRRGQIPVPVNPTPES
jgi:hypothetical protein